jgi:pre-mRNA-processing factor 6
LTTADTPWYQYVQEEREVLQEGIQRFPDAPKLHMMLGQLEERDNSPSAARKALQTGLKHNSKCVPMWIMLAQLEEKQGSVPAARAILEQGRLRNPRNPELWQAAVRTEVRAGNLAAASATLTRGVQDCEGTDNVGKLWALYIGMAQRTQRKARMQDAVKKADDDPYVFAAVGDVFLADRKYDKARKFLQRATVLDSDIGDFWGMWVSCEEAAKSPDVAANVMAAAKKV